MNNQIITLLTLLIGTFQVDSHAQQYSVGSDFEMSIHGGSNMHDWTSHVLTFAASGDLTLENDRTWRISDLKIEIPVASIESEKGSIMDKKTMKALQAEVYPMITFHLTGLTGNTDLSASGTLEVAGVERSIDIRLVSRKRGTRQLEISGVKDLKMTDFGIDPPKALMGALKVDDEITIDFRMTLTESEYNH